MKNSIKHCLKSVSIQTGDKTFLLEEGDSVTLFYFGEGAPVHGRFISEDEDVIVLGINDSNDMAKKIKEYAKQNDGMAPAFSVYSKLNLKSITKNIKHG